MLCRSLNFSLGINYNKLPISTILYSAKYCIELIKPSKLSKAIFLGYSGQKKRQDVNASYLIMDAAGKVG